MASIGDLPVELLLNIFKLIYDDDDTDVNDLEDDFFVEGGYPEHSLHTSMCQMEDDLHNPTLFPMTLTFVCHYWRDILAKSPEYWNKVVFEVGRDPTPLLDAFSWSNDQILDVLVWNRIPDLTAAGKVLENERVSAITQSLTPHFHRCSRIRYEVTYSSSLPPIESIFWTKPYILRQFVLEPRVDDIQYDHSTNLTSMKMDDNALLVTPFSILSVLSLGARLFIDLGRAGWLHNLRSDVYLTLTLSQFRFQQQKGYGDDERYTFLEFLNHLSTMPQPDVLRLRNLSLLYEPGTTTTDPKYSLKPTSSLCLDNLGENILTEFFEKTILSCDSICINRCTIPWIDCSLVSTYLYLDNIGYIHNISNILWVWQGSHLSLDSCAAFDDDLLDRLEDEGRNWCLKFLTDLTLKDCINFTSAGLRKLMMLQKAMAAAEDNQVMLDRVSVVGGRLSLWEDDISWFRQQRGSTDVSWTIIHPDGTFAYPLNHYSIGED